MELKKFSDNRPALATQAIPEGRMVLLTSHSEDHNWGSWSDLVGLKLPANGTEARRARYVAGFPVEQRPAPFYEPQPSAGQGSQRYGWSEGPNVPFSATVHVTPPGNTKFGVILEGRPAIAWGQGEFLVYSGAFVPDSGLEPGALLEALNVADDTLAEAGKLNLTVTADDAIAEVVHYDPDAQTLHFRTFNP